MNYVLITNYGNPEMLNNAINNVKHIIDNSGYKVNIVSVSNYNNDNKNSIKHIASVGNHYFAGMEYIKSIDENGIIVFFDSDDIMYKDKFNILNNDFNKYGAVSNYIKQNNRIIKHTLLHAINIKYFNLEFFRDFKTHGFDVMLYYYALDNNIKIHVFKKVYNEYVYNPNSITHRNIVEYNKTALTEWEKIKGLNIFHTEKVRNLLDKRILEVDLRLKYDTHEVLRLRDILKYYKLINLDFRNDLFIVVKTFILLLPHKKQIELYPLSKHRLLKRFHFKY